MVAAAAVAPAPARVVVAAVAPAQAVVPAPAQAVVAAVASVLPAPCCYVYTSSLNNNQNNYPELENMQFTTALLREFTV